jgi:uncharacterized membrane protein YoaK (UPF0700 family)
MMNDEEKRPLPAHKRQSRRNDEQRVLYLVIFTLLAVGGGLIGLIFGWEAMLTAVPCLLGGAFLILVPWGLLTLAEKWRDKLD